MYSNIGELRWYQGPARLSQILVFTILVKEKKNEVGAFTRSKDFQVFNGKYNLSDWCIGVMEGFGILVKNPATKMLNLTSKGEELYNKIKSEKSLYEYLKNLFDNRTVSQQTEEKTMNELQKAKESFEEMKRIVNDSEQFHNAYVFLLENGSMTIDEFKQGFYSEILFLYNGEIPITNSNTATTADNRTPFIYHFGEYFGLMQITHGRITLNKNINQVTISHKKTKISRDVDEDIINQIDNVRITRAIAFLETDDLEKNNNRTPEKYDKPIGTKERYKTNPRISKTALSIADYKCEYGLINNEDHVTFKSKFGYSYVEAHHLIPMSAQADFPNINLDRTENIVSLCPVCHSAIHYGNKEERKTVLTKLYHYKIIGLRKISKELVIGVDELLSKYYK